VARPALVEVIWFDACTYSEGPQSAEEIARKDVLPERHTTGYVVFEDARRLVVAQTYDPDDKTFDDRIAIPAPWVRRRRRK
jgi:hypothetical protein